MKYKTLTSLLLIVSTAMFASQGTKENRDRFEYAAWHSTNIPLLCQQTHLPSLGFSSTEELNSYLKNLSEKYCYAQISPDLFFGCPEERAQDKLKYLYYLVRLYKTLLIQKLEQEKDKATC